MTFAVPAADSARAGETGPRPRLLLADGDADRREGLRRLLADRYDVEAAPDAVAALDSARGRPPDLVLCDATLPGRDGLNLLRALRADPALCAVPVVLLSARAGDGSLVEALEAGADDYLVKPFSAHELLARVRLHLELGRLRRAASHREREAHAEAALRESEERYRDLFENANDVIYTLDLEGRITSVNKRAEETFGYDRAECLGLDARQLVPPEQHERMYEALRRKLSGEAAPTTYELDVLRKDGRRVPLEVSSRLILRDGRPAGIQGIARDVTERRRAEAERERLLGQLRQAARRQEEARALLDTLMKTAPVGLAFVDRDLRYLRINDTLAAINGVRPEQALGRTLREVVPDLAARVEPLYRCVLETGQPLSGLELSGETPAAPGELRHWLVSYYPVHARDEEILGIGAVITEITERKRLEDELRRRADLLAEADRRKDEFLAMLAHELRNPLAPIRNAVQILRLLGRGDPAAERARDMIARQVTHLARLVDDLLDVSRITRGKILLRKERLDLARLVRAAVEDHRAVLEGTGLKLGVEVPDGPLWLVGDPTRLAQVVGNLLHNAGKFTDAGGLVTLRLAVEADGRAALLTVRDTGIGMEADILGRLFEPFSQADRSLDRSRGGLGLGLALIKGLVELHGGSVRATSPGPGQGSEFAVRLPLSGGLGEERALADRPSAGKSLRVLVVEDNVDSAESLRMLLELSGHRVEVAHTGTAGMEAARRLCPDVVLCDIGLPGGMDGYAVARALRADAEQTVATLIAVSGYGQEEDQRQARQAGFDRHLTKPVDPLVLTQLLDALPVRPGR